jgi:excinuclease UvrABC ATPase subunit
MDFEEIRQICRRRLDARKRLYEEDEQETLHPCPGCNGGGQVQLSNKSDPTRYRMICCPWCDGNGFTDMFMIVMYEEHQRS